LNLYEHFIKEESIAASLMLVLQLLGIYRTKLVAVGRSVIEPNFQYIRRMGGGITRA